MMLKANISAPPSTIGKYWKPWFQWEAGRRLRELSTKIFHESVIIR